MIKYSLTCKKCDYAFNSWFSTSEEFDRLEKKKLLICPECNSLKIIKSIMSPNISGGTKIDKDKLKFKIDLRKKMLEYQKLIKENFKYVGEDFAYESRRVYYDKKKSKAIYGKATIKEIKELNEEGIETTTIPWIEKIEN